MSTVICHSLTAVADVVPLRGPNARPITTLQQLIDGAQLPATTVILVVPSFGETDYQLRAVVDGMLGPALRTARLIVRPGICVLCGRIAPCAHSRRS